MSLELPKLSTFTKLLATPETYFENMVKNAFKLELPPGPQSTLLKIQESLEAGRALAPEEFMPRAPVFSEILSKLPTLPTLPEIGPVAREETQEKKEVKEEKEEKVLLREGEQPTGKILLRS